MEQEEYRKEEINWSYIEFIDNQDVLDLIEKVCAYLQFAEFIVLFILVMNSSSKAKIQFEIV